MIDTIQNNRKSQLNVNEVWLTYLVDLFKSYGKYKLDNDLENCYSVLDLLVRTNTKIDRERLQARLDMVGQYINKSKKTDRVGKLICWYPEIISYCFNELDGIYSDIISEMDKAGQLTRLTEPTMRVD